MPIRPTVRPLLGLGILCLSAANMLHRSHALPELWRGLLLGVGLTLLVTELCYRVFPAQWRKLRG